MARSTPGKTRPRLPRGRTGKKASEAQLNQATSDEFEREGMGIAPKE